MNHLIIFFKVILIVSLFECYNSSEILGGESSGDCVSANEVTHVLTNTISSAEDDYIQSLRRKYNIDKNSAGEEVEETITSKTDNETATIENITGEYQDNSSSEEDENESRSTLVDFSFSVSIQKKGAHYVSGALIGNQWVLSVAKEFFHVRESLKLFRARLGSVDCKKGGTLLPLRKIEIHPYYIYGKPNFDISLLQLAKPVGFSDVINLIPISTVKGKVLSGQFMTTYWPRIVVNGNALSQNAKERTHFNSMRVSTQKIIPGNLCRNVMAAIKENLHESSLCLKPVVTHHSVCMPDAGAPVVAEDGLWGITSGWISPTCPLFAAPTIFTRISSLSVRSWLGTQLNTTSAGLSKNETFNYFYRGNLDRPVRVPPGGGQVP